MSSGIDALLPRERMSPGARKLRDAYAIVPGAPLVMKEFGYYVIDRWIREGHLPSKGAHEAIAERFGFDEQGFFPLGGLGWCEAAFVPPFETLVLEDRGEHELGQDHAGRKILYFKGRRSGFMPDYVGHPVTDMKSWVDLCKWRMDPETPERWTGLAAKMEKAKNAAAQGKMIQANLIGGYMYLRSLIGPLELTYMFYDAPEVIHACMETWLTLADATLAKYQEHVTFDEFYIAEDICYNKGPLISPAMMRGFLFPYYAQLLNNVRARQIDKSRRLYFQVDTDGDCRPVIDVYGELGMDVMSPFEVASGCDVVEIGKQYPNLVMSGGIDKRVLAVGGQKMEDYLRRILDNMRARGGYIPTCDHGVPEEVSFANFARYREIMLEYAR